MATYYISPTGNDTSGSGTLAAPWATIAKAVTSSIAGDTIICTSGSYSFLDQTITNRTIQGTSASSVIFDGNGGSYKWAFADGTTSISNIWFKNIIVTVSQGIFNYPTITSAVFNLTSCKFSNICCYGGVFGGLISTNGWATFASGSVIIQGCVFDDITQGVGSSMTGLFYIWGPTSVAVTFNGCTFVQKTTSGKIPYVFEIGDTSAGITSTCDIKNSIFVNKTATTSYFSYTTWNKAAYTLTNCDYHGSWADGAGSVTKTNCITSDPLFVDENGGDFRLRPTSPCIDNGGIT